MRDEAMRCFVKRDGDQDRQQPNRDFLYDGIELRGHGSLYGFPGKVGGHYMAGARNTMIAGALRIVFDR
jgi:hypothetical protein